MRQFKVIHKLDGEERQVMLNAESSNAAAKQVVKMWEELPGTKVEIVNVEEIAAPQKEKEIIDAEYLLYEMDVNNSDSIVIKEGYGEKIEYSREEVEKYLGLRD